MGLVTKRLINKKIVLVTAKIDAGIFMSEPTELDGARNCMSHRIID